MKRKTGKFLLTAAGAASAAALIRSVQDTSWNFADIAMNRKLTDKEAGIMRAMEKQQQLEPALKERKKSASEKLRGSSLKTVRLTARDRIHLTGHLYLADDPQRTVIAVHGWRSDWAGDFGLIADFLCRNRCNVLYIEQRAHGASGGDYIAFGLRERYDVLEWISWVNEQEFSELPVYLAGLSMGAATVLMAAGESLPGNVHGVIADSGYTTPRAEWKYVAENSMHCCYGLFDNKLNQIFKNRIGVSLDAYSCAEAMQTCRIPVLFIHGSDDTFVPIEMCYDNYMSCASSKRLLVVPGAGHCQSYLVEQERYEKEVVQFWEKYDRLPA